MKTYLKINNVPVTWTFMTFASCRPRMRGSPGSETRFFTQLNNSKTDTERPDNRDQKWAKAAERLTDCWVCVILHVFSVNFD